MKAEIYSNEFNRIISATKSFVGKNNHKRIYRFIRLEFCELDSVVTAVAVDGYRLSIEHAVCKCDSDFTAYINANTRLPNNMYASLEVTDEDTIIRCGDFIFGCPKIDGEFLEWKNVLPSSEPTFRIGVNGNYLLEALTAAKCSLGKSFKNLVVLEFHGATEPILLRTNKDDIKMVLPIRIGN